MSKPNPKPTDNTGDKKAREAAAKKLNAKQRATEQGNKNAAKGGKAADKETRSALRRLLGG